MDKKSTPWKTFICIGCGKRGFIYKLKNYLQSALHQDCNTYRYACCKNPVIKEFDIGDTMAGRKGGG